MDPHGRILGFLDRKRCKPVAPQDAENDLLESKNKKWRQSKVLGEFSANLCGLRVLRGQRNGSPRPYSRISRPHEVQTCYVYKRFAYIHVKTNPQTAQWRDRASLYPGTVDSRLSAVMVGRTGANNQNQRINRSTHTQARYTGILINIVNFLRHKTLLKLTFCDAGQCSSF
jgi:hypothetical protein